MRMGAIHTDTGCVNVDAIYQNLTNACLNAVLASCEQLPSVTHLDLSHCRLNEETTALLLQWLNRKSCPRLKLLEVAKSDVGCATMKEVVHSYNVYLAGTALTACTSRSSFSPPSTLMDSTLAAARPRSTQLASAAEPVVHEVLSSPELLMHILNLCDVDCYWRIGLAVSKSLSVTFARGRNGAVTALLPSQLSIFEPPLAAFRITILSLSAYLERVKCLERVYSTAQAASANLTSSFRVSPSSSRRATNSGAQRRVLWHRSSPGGGAPKRCRSEPFMRVRPKTCYAVSSTDSQSTI